MVPVKVLLEKVSVPAKVAKVPEAGKVTDEPAALAAKVIVFVVVCRFPPKVRVLPPPVRVILDPVTDNIRELVLPPETVKPSPLSAKVKPLYEPPVTTPVDATLKFSLTEKRLLGSVVPMPTLPPRKPKSWVLMSMPVARDNCPPNWKSTVDSVNPLEAVYAPIPVQEVLHSPLRHRFPLIAALPLADSKEEMLAVPPMPTLPTKLEIPETFKVFKAAAEVTVKDLPIPTLPVVVKEDRVVAPVTSRVEESVAAPVTANVEERVVAPVTANVLDRVLAPVTAKVEESVVAPETVKVPVMAGESFKAMVMELPSLTSPPPVRLVPAVTVILASVKAEAGMLVKVLSAPDIVLLVKVCVVSIPTRVVVASGRVITLAAVGVQVKVPVGPPLWNTSWSLVPERLRVEKVGEAAVDTS